MTCGFSIPGSVSGREFNGQFTAAVQRSTTAVTSKPVAFSSAASIMLWTLMNARNGKDSLLTDHPLPNTGRVVLTGNPISGWTLVDWDGITIVLTPEMAAAHFAMPLRVRYVECDMQGRAFNGHYLTWVDMAHTEALREIVGGYQVLIDRGIDVVVAAAELQFRLPARFDDELIVHVAIEAPGRTSLRSRYRVPPRRRGDRRGDDDPRLRRRDDLRETALAGLVPRAARRRRLTVSLPR